MNTINTIAPCGMNCALCYAFQDRKKPCSGCRSKMAEVRKNCRNCLILSCDKRVLLLRMFNFPMQTVKIVGCKIPY